METELVTLNKGGDDASSLKDASTSFCTAPSSPDENTESQSLYSRSRRSSSDHIIDFQHPAEVAGREEVDFTVEGLPADSSADYGADAPPEIESENPTPNTNNTRVSCNSTRRNELVGNERGAEAVSSASEPSDSTADSAERAEIAQPQIHQCDPTSWGFQRKVLVFIQVLTSTIIADLSSRLGGAWAMPIAEIFDVALTTVQRTINIGQLVTGMGGLLGVPISHAFGRLPVMFWSTIGMMLTRVVQIFARDFTLFTVLELLHGLFSGAVLSIGFLVITDMYEGWKRDRMIDIWTLPTILTPYIAPIFPNGVASQEWRSFVRRLLGGMTIAAALIVLTGRETNLDPEIRAQGRTINHFRFQCLVGTAQWRQQKRSANLFNGIQSLIKIFRNRYIFALVTYHTLTTAWIIPTSTVFAQPGNFIFECLITLPPPRYISQHPIFGIPCTGFVDQVHQGPKRFYDYSPAYLASALGPPIASMVAASSALVFGIGVLCFEWWTEKLRGRRKSPHARLWLFWFAQPLLVLGLILFGISVAKNLDSEIVVISWGLYMFGTLIVIVVVSSTLVRSFLQAAGEVGAWLNFSKAMGAYATGLIADNMLKRPLPQQGQGAIKIFVPMAVVSSIIFLIVPLLQRHKVWL